MYELNGIILKIVKSWVHEGEDNLDPRIGRKCFELESNSKRYSLRCFQEDLDLLTLVE